MKPELLNGANLAFIGDAYFELMIRRHLLDLNITKQAELQRLASKYVSAKGHNKIVKKLIDSFSEEELSVFKRGKNHKINLTRKNLDLSEYLNSSGFEALIGYLYLLNNFERLNLIIEAAIKVIEEDNE